MRDVPGALRRELVPVILMILAGIVAGLAWSLLTPFALHHSDQQEALFAGDGALAAVTAACGVITGLVVVFRPGPAPTVRVSVVVLGSVVASLVALLTGVATGAPGLKAAGVILIWPVFGSIVIFVGAMLPFTSDRISSADSA